MILYSHHWRVNFLAYKRLNYQVPGRFRFKKRKRNDIHDKIGTMNTLVFLYHTIHQNVQNVLPVTKRTNNNTYSYLIFTSIV